MKIRLRPEEAALCIQICIRKYAARGRRLTQGMYDHLFNTLYPHHSIFTRTWSTNIAHSTILSRMGFSELSRVKDERGAGIDTVYFALIRE